MPYIHLWTGNGAGKTTSALGVALREVGHKQKVVIIQFMKGRKDIGEYKIRERLRPYYEIHQFGTREFTNLKHPSEKDKKRAQDALEFAKEKSKEKPHLIILDEINLACAIGLLDTKKVIPFLKKTCKKTNVFLTGRHAPEELVKKADFVTEIREIKYPKNISARKGIEY